VPRLLVGEPEHVDGHDGLAERRVERVSRVEDLTVLDRPVGPEPATRVLELLGLVERAPCSSAWLR